jgi:flagellar assembly protein FliH
MAQIIKANPKHAQPMDNAQSPATPRVFEFEDWTRRSDAFLERIRSKADEIIQAAQNEAEAIRQQAESSGFENGRQRAIDEAFVSSSEKLKTLFPALEQFVDQLVESRGTWEREWENKLIQLATAIGSRLARRELSRNSDVSVSWIREAMEFVTGAGRVVVSLNPEDQITLGPHVEALHEQFCGAGELQIREDPQIDPGGCLVETEFGTIDQQLKSQVQRLFEELTH